MKITEHFYHCAGLKLNREKTEGILLGQNNNNDLSKYGIKIVKDTVRSLGILVGKDTNNIIEANFNLKIKKIKNLLNMWKGRNLTIKGKITILRSYALPLIIYPASVLYTPPNIIKEVDNLFFDFVWPKKHHVKKKVLCQQIEAGGLKMPNIENMIKAIKLTWIKRLLYKNNNYTTIAKANANIKNIETYIINKITCNHLKNKPLNFYQQILNAWNEITNTQHMNTNEILNEKLWLNPKILINKSMAFYQDWKTNGVALLNDIMHNGVFKTQEELVNLLGFEINIMEYNCLKSSIPRSWIKEIKTNPITFKIIDDHSIKIGNKYKKIEKITCKDFYWQLSEREITRPTALNKWEELYFYANFDWKEIFKIPYLVARETSLQSLQYQIINRYFPCKYTVNLWHKDEDDKCSHCNDIETIEHYFFLCDKVQIFWKSFYNWWKNIYNVTIKLGQLDIIFGIINENKDDMLHVLNFCILLAKKYIYDCKLNNKQIVLLDFIAKIKKRLEIEKLLCNMNGCIKQFNLKWEQVYQHV